jgi:hypothetical protein
MIDEFIQSGMNTKSGFFKKLTIVSKDDSESTTQIWMSKKESIGQTNVMCILYVFIGFTFPLIQEIVSKMDEEELKVKISCGAVIEELDPAIPVETQNDLAENKRIYRYKFTRQTASTTTSVKRQMQKIEEANADEAPHAHQTRPT